MPKLIYHEADGVEKVLPLGAEPVLVGRSTECQLQTQDALVSRRHARIYWDGNYWIEDLGSSNGVFLGSERVQKVPFRPGDTVTCGKLVLRLLPDTTPRTTGSSLSASSSAPAWVAPPPVAPSRTATSASASAPGRDATLAPAIASPLSDPSLGRVPPRAATGVTGFAAHTPTLATPGAPGDAPRTAGEVQVGPNAVLRGATAPALPSGAVDELRQALQAEKQRRLQAEAAALSGAERLRTAEGRLVELEGAARDGAAVQRKLDQALADLRRLRGGAAPEATPVDEPAVLRQRVIELEAQLAAAIGAAGRAPPRGAGSDPAAPPTAEPAAAAGPPPEVADAALALGDAFSQLRASLRAADDEAALLTAPATSVAVVREALRAASEELATARDQLRVLGRYFDLP